MVGDALAHVAVLLRRAGRVELLELEPVVDDRLEQVERADRVRHHRLVRAVPRLADVRLGAEVEDVGAVGRASLQLPDEVVDRRPVGEVGEVHLEAVAQVPDVVQRAARGRAHEGVHVGAELDERVREVRAHETVRTGDEHGATRVGVAELAAELVECGVGPGGVGHGAYASASVSKRTGSSGLGSLGERGAHRGSRSPSRRGSRRSSASSIAHEFGRTAETDGFFAAYGVFVVARARRDRDARRRCCPRSPAPATTAASAARSPRYALALAVVACRCSSSPRRAADPSPGLLTGFGPDAARDTAAAHAALDGSWPPSASCSPGSPRARSPRSTTTRRRPRGFALGSVAGLVLILAPRRSTTGSRRSRGAWR